MGKKKAVKDIFRKILEEKYLSLAGENDDELPKMISTWTNKNLKDRLCKLQAVVDKMNKD